MAPDLDERLPISWQSPHVRFTSPPSRVWAYCSSFCLRARSLISPLETGAQSDSASASTRGASDSIACLFAFVCCGTCKRRESVCGNRGHTSQFSRIKQRPPATDLSGPKASEVSLTPRRSNFAEAAAVDFQLDLCSSAAALLALSPVRSPPSCALPVSEFEAGFWLTSLAPAGVLSDLGLLLVSGCLSFFFSRENESRKLMAMLGLRRWW